MRDVPRRGARTHVDPATGAFCGTSNGIKKRVSGVPKWGVGAHVDLATGAFGVAPYGATKRVMGRAEKKGADACGPCHWGLRCSSLWGHETNEWRAETKGADACGPCQWGLRWGSLRGNETCEGRARTMGADAYGHCHQGLRPSVELRRARVARIFPPSPVGPLSDGPRASPNYFQMQFPCTFIFCPTCFWNYDPF